MALGDPFITGVQLGQYMRMDYAKVPIDAVRDEELTSAVEAASNAIRKACGRDFNQSDVATTRKYRALGSRMVIVGDFYTTDDLVIQSGPVNADPVDTWDATDYELEPFDGVVNGVEGFPFTRIKLSRWKWLWGYDRIQVTAKWGWSEIPANVIQATKILGAELYKLYSAPFGAGQMGSGSGGSTSVVVQDVPQVWMLICNYERSENRVFLG